MSELEHGISLQSLETIPPSISYQIRESVKAKYLRISVSYDGRVVVTKPKSISLAALESLVKQKMHWIIKKLTFFTQLPRIPIRRSTRAEYRTYCESARVLVYSRIEKFNATYGFSIRRISIRNQKTRWGSCSKKGNLNFNYRIVHLPPELVDYIVVHELCHLAELNHSKRFWQLVSKVIPDHNYLKLKLRRTLLA